MSGDEAREVSGATLMTAWHWPHAAGLLGGLTAVAALAAVVLGHGARAGVGVAWWLGCIVSALVLWAKGRPRPVDGSPMTARATREGLFVGGKLVAPHDAIRSGAVVPSAGRGPLLKLDLRGFGRAP